MTAEVRHQDLLNFAINLYPYHSLVDEPGFFRPEAEKDATILHGTSRFICC